MKYVLLIAVVLFAGCGLRDDTLQEVKRINRDAYRTGFHCGELQFSEERCMNIYDRFVSE